MSKPRARARAIASPIKAKGNARATANTMRLRRSSEKLWQGHLNAKSSRSRPGWPIVLSARFDPRRIPVRGSTPGKKQLEVIGIIGAAHRASSALTVPLASDQSLQCLIHRLHFVVEVARGGDGFVDPVRAPL